MSRIKSVFFAAICSSVLSFADTTAGSAGFSSPVGGEISTGFDYFHGLPDGSWNGNEGAFLGLNLAVALYKTLGIGGQVGVSYGLYNWYGKGYVESKSITQQAFGTIGFFRQTPHDSGVNGGLVVDAMYNANTGLYALNPTVGQVRGRIAYLFRKSNEFGAWASCRLGQSQKSYDHSTVVFQAVNQVNIFWSHFFKIGAETTVWIGLPYGNSLLPRSDGAPGQYIVGASFKAPLARRFFVEGRGQFMGADSAPALQQSQRYDANFCLFLTYAFGDGKAGTVPYMPLANNSNFLLDTNNAW